MSNLLAIDWDYFFPSPMEGSPTTGHDMFFDWGHYENAFMIERVWPHRAVAFVGNDLPLPMVNDEWKSFLSRFQFTDDVVSYYSESNMLAGGLTSPDGQPFESVWLFDAHHDSGYHPTTLAEWQATGRYSCEDWMLMHAQDGSELHVRHPRWMSDWSQPSVKDVKVDIDRDDFGSLDVVFDTIHLCRSGAWVPPWCDEQFFEFTEALPGDVEEIGSYAVVPREFDMENVRKMLAERQKIMAMAEGTDA